MSKSKAKPKRSFALVKRNKIQLLSRVETPVVDNVPGSSMVEQSPSARKIPVRFPVWTPKFLTSFPHRFKWYNNHKKNTVNYLIIFKSVPCSLQCSSYVKFLLIDYLIVLLRSWKTCTIIKKHRKVNSRLFTKIKH